MYIYEDSVISHCKLALPYGVEHSIGFCKHCFSSLSIYNSTIYLLIYKELNGQHFCYIRINSLYTGQKNLTACMYQNLLVIGSHQVSEQVTPTAFYFSSSCYKGFN